ncbi:MAG: hypothetical protein KJ771_08525 [Nanoarchaeota archaeon]|nr:hypothetical protein [Nanoarchaeota archaeon]
MATIHQILIGFLASALGIIIGILTDELFIKRTKNRRPYLTPIGVALFGKNKGSSSEFVKANKAVFIKITDIVVGLLIGSVSYILAFKLIEKTFIFYFPLFLIIINSIYLMIRKEYYKIKLGEGLIISLVYIISVIFIYLIIKYKWFGL